MRSRFKRLSVILVLTSLAPPASWARSPVGRNVELLIAGGTVYRGDETEPIVMDIGITGDKIVFIGNASKAHIQSKKTLDARGMMVTPGLIDAHSHIEDELASPDASERLVARQITQGVTTSIIGVDGHGTPDIHDEFDKMEHAGIGQNVAAYVGFAGVRERVLQHDARAPTPTELQTMKSLTAKGMCEGAIGLSSGLFYAPQSFASTEEVIAVAKEAGKRGGLYDTHQRDEGTSSIGVLTSLQEAIRIGEESGAPLHLAHIKVTNSSRPDGQDMTEVIALIEAARAKGQNVTADQYPWAAANTGLEAVAIPRWAQAGGFEAMVKRFDNPADLAKIKAETGLAPGFAEKTMIGSAPKQPELVGKRLSEIAANWGVDPTDAAIRILRNGAASVVVFVMTETDIVKVMTKPWVMSSSDGSEGVHPRGHASYPRLWENYVIAQKVLTPVQFVHRSTGLEADTFGLTERGYIKPGYFADLAVIDPKTYHARASYIEPKLMSTGVVDVIVSGRLEFEDGKPTGILSGRTLTRAPRPGTCP